MVHGMNFFLELCFKAVERKMLRTFIQVVPTLGSFKMYILNFSKFVLTTSSQHFEANLMFKLCVEVPLQKLIKRSK